MRVVRCVSKEQLAYDAAVAGADKIREALHRRGEATIALATGTSQIEMLAFLVRENLDWGRVTAFHLDEYCGLKANHPGSFRNYIKQHFVNKVPLKAFIPIAGEKNPITECVRLNKILSQRPVDVAFVGIGENGHLAFNDPPADFEVESPYIVVRLDKACRRQQVKEGWFGTLLQVPTKAISMTVQQLMSAHSIICSVPEKRKAKAAKAALEGPVTPKVPASILQQHPQCTVFLDPESACLLGITLRPLVHDVVSLPLIPRTMAPGMKRFHLLLVGDWRKIPDKDVVNLARQAGIAGAATVTAWGPGSFAVKLAFETESMRDSARTIPVTCYKEDEVGDALYFFLEDVKDSVRTCNAWVAVVAGSPSHREKILASLADPAAFIDDYIQNANDSRP